MIVSNILALNKYKKEHKLEQVFDKINQQEKSCVEMHQSFADRLTNHTEAIKLLNEHNKSHSIEIRKISDISHM